MAFEHGSIDLGIHNPFKIEGAIRATRGLIVSLMGFWLLLGVADLVQTNRIAAWVTAAVGIVLLGGGLTALGGGLFQMMRFFVGRSVPTSLAFNYSKSERDTAQTEQADVQYTGDQIEQMLMGRKNVTFEEPHGWIARLIHSVFPKLTFLPFPIRNVAQRLAAACVKTGVAAVSFTLAWFTTATGLVGDAGNLMIPVFSFILLMYLLTVWRRTGTPISRAVSRAMETVGSLSLTWAIAFSILLPVVLGILASVVQSDMVNVNNEATAIWQDIQTVVVGFSPGKYIWMVVILSAISTVALLLMVALRAKDANPVTEVSELRDNWQEPVHPRDIFINIDNIIMANRRYKEVPNRVYRDLVPRLNEDAAGKGAFTGEMIQETQPAFKEVEHSPMFKMSRLFCSALGQLLYVFAAVLFMNMVDPITTFASSVIDMKNNAASYSGQGLTKLQMGIFEDFVLLVNIGFAWLICSVFGRLLSNLSHIFWGEMLFESLLIYFKCEGTFTESKLSTGTGIYDSTQSENVVVRSSITPWLIVSRILSSTFSGVGSRNLEYPRHILEMKSDNQEMSSIIEDLKSFMRDREAIVTIRNERDLDATSSIAQINQQTRAIPMVEQSDSARLTQDAEGAAGVKRED